MTTYGAIRWDVGWYGNLLFVDEPEKHCTRNPEYQDLAPWWTVRDASGNTLDGIADQAIMDQEIAFALQASLDYWAFFRYVDRRDQGRPTPDPALALYQSSTARGALKYCSIEEFGTFGDSTDYLTKIGRIVTEVQQPHYFKVLGNRPLIYLFNLSDTLLIQWFGSRAMAKMALDALRAAIIATGLGNPYIAVMMSSHQGSATLLSDLGADAATQYTAYVPQVANAPYSALRTSAVAGWENFRTNAGKIIPTAMSGWNQNARRARSPFRSIWPNMRKGGIVLPPTPAEMAAHFAEAKAYLLAHPTECEAQTFIAYSWNEFSEGYPCLCPTRGNPTGTHLPLIAAAIA